MSGEAEENDKQFAPTQKKLDDARKKGEIARSTDLTTAAAYGGMLLVLATIGPDFLGNLAAAMAHMLRHADAISISVFEGRSGPALGGLFKTTLTSMSIWFLAPAGLALVMLIGQRAIIFAPDKIAPKLNRISVISGVKNKFGRQGLFEFLKSTSKLTIYAGILGVFLISQIDPIIGSIRLTPAFVILELGRLLTTLIAIVLLVAIVIGAVDYSWQHAEHIRKNMMSRKEIMDELKQSEGDPLLKQQRRQRAQEIALNKMLADVPEADVIIVNPTHYAVALKWDRSAGRAPVCTAKGVDEIASRMRGLAHEHAVPIHSDPPTARALHASVEVGNEILPEHYRAVAAAIRFAENVRLKARSI